MACRVGLIGFTLILAALLHGAAADTYTVLEGLGWSIPTSNNDGVYRTWAASKDFEVGDNLIFNFQAGAHNVAKVSKADYTNCGKANPISIITTPPANVTLDTEGEHYFICTVDQHCESGQKLAINVTADSDTRTPTPTPRPANSPPGGSGPGTRPPGATPFSPPPPPPPSAASSITVGSFSIAILSIVLVFLH